MATTFAGNGLAGELRNREGGSLPDRNLRRHDLGHLDVDSQTVQVGDFEQLLAGGARVDQRADIGLAGRHDAIEGGGDALIGLQRLQPADIGLGRGDQRRLRFLVARLLVHGLLRDGLRSLKSLPPLGGERGEPLIGLGGRKIGLGLDELLVEVGRIDGGKLLARLDVRADVPAPALQIAGDPRIDLGDLERLDGSRQIHVARVPAIDLGERHGRYGLRCRPLFIVLGAVRPADEATGTDDQGEGNSAAAEQLETTRYSGIGLNSGDMVLVPSGMEWKFEGRGVRRRLKHLPPCGICHELPRTGSAPGTPWRRWRR